MRTRRVRATYGRVCTAKPHKYIHQFPISTLFGVFFTSEFKFFKKLIKLIENVPGITRTLLIISVRHNRCTLLPIPSLGICSFWWGGRPVSCDRCNPTTGNGNSLCHRAGDFTYWPNISPVSLNYFPIWPFVQYVRPYLHTFPPEAELLDEI